MNVFNMEFCPFCPSYPIKKGVVAQSWYPPFAVTRGPSKCVNNNCPVNLTLYEQDSVCGRMTLTYKEITFNFCSCEEIEAFHVSKFSYINVPMSQFNKDFISNYESILTNIINFV